MKWGLHALLQGTNEVLGLGVRELAGFEERAGHVRAASALGVFFGILFSAFNMATPGMEVLGQAELAVVLVLLVPAVVASRWPHWVGLAEVLVVLASMGFSFALLIFGGIEGTGLFWVGMVPFLGFFIGGQRNGWLYCLAMIGAMTLYFTGIQRHLPWAHQHSSVVATQFVLSFVFYTLVAAAFNRARSQFEDKLQQRVEEKTADAKALLAQMEYLATHDTLTGLPNQLLLVQQLGAAIDQARTQNRAVVVCVMRLERMFELCNVLGAEGGDQLVREVSAQLQGLCGERGTLARTRRDEFAVIYPLHQPHVQPAQLQQFLLEHPISIQVQGYSLFLEFTVGLAVFPEHAASADRLLHRAEQAMLQAYRSDQSWSLYNEDLEKTFVRHHLLFGRLRDALQLGHLQVHFQPQIDLHTGQLHGAEALARWWDPVSQSMVPPVTFIPVAEESGLIRPLTRWLIGECLRHCASWHAMGRPLDVSINLSAMNLLDPELISVLQQSLQDTGLAPRHVNLEITESCFMDSPERAMEVVRHLHSLGFRLSIDDFGTGYSSLSYLKNLPIDELKIDQGFVRNLLDNPGDQAIVASTLDLAHNLRLSVVAEGIEDSATALWLRARGCEFGQGYHFARPMSAEDFLHFAGNFTPSLPPTP
ncbi:bifunctional diguanylate cyclase/phosphodiesterase [Curvibacter sp. APW13]|uniref:putative bifunctional diguanylate cyclase/phosphodiesterase n=1 Tax=Curvibacter sp. APW13 TaxID=3077236 RepID=UPI0028DE7262|nr:bifunctional diguanylate cyclase/phosphodiesterase [Curvibacter sp. APW13]MDT8990196.1 bifunctional diguanylate cyclase/phosphodiesterase [Curvibacter sp. APW13]